MDEEMPDLQIDIIAITLDRLSGRVSVDHQGMNYLEAIGVLTVALNQIQDTPFEYEMSDMEDDDE